MWCKGDDLETLQYKVMEEVPVEGQRAVLRCGVNQWYFRGGDRVVTPTLLVHGYGASSMAYHRCFAPLSRHIRDLYAIDLPANGLSEAPPLVAEGEAPKAKFKIEENKFTVVQGARRAAEPVTDAQVDQELMLRTHREKRRYLQQYEDYYVESIEQWRKENNLDKFNLVGHSFGGYLSYKYALKYPESVNKLCLLSPLGMERNIHSINNTFEENVVYELQESDPSSYLYTRKRKAPKFLFENQFSVLRWMGPIGDKLCLSFINSSYAKVPCQAYKDYLFESFLGKKHFAKQNVHALKHLFTRSLLARDPIMDTIDKLKVPDVSVFYGDHDWMNSYAGYLMVERLKKFRVASTSGGSASYLEVPDAGHNLFLDNPDYFSKKLVQFLSE
ncbi:alpha/beta hydrolase fold [Nakaseomyces glabratus]